MHDNPYESPRCIKEGGAAGNALEQIKRVLVLALVGYGVFVLGVVFCVLANRDCWAGGVRWWSGLLVSFALVLSEAFVIRSSAIRITLVRRILISSAICLGCVVGTESLISNIMTEAPRSQGRAIAPRVVVGVVVCAILTIATRLYLHRVSRGNLK